MPHGSVHIDLDSHRDCGFVPPQDAALSDIIATTMLLGVTITIAGVAALNAADVFEPERGSAMRLDLGLFARPSQDVVTLLHQGGQAVDAQDLRALVLVDGAVAYDANASMVSHVWRFGEPLDVGPLSSPIPVGARVDVTIAHRAGGEVLASMWTRATLAQAAGPAAPGFAIGLTLAGGGASEIVLQPPAGLLVEARVDHPDGRKLIRSVFADLTGADGVIYEELRDDGVNGDARMSDGIYSAVAIVPVNFTSGMATVTATAIDFNGSMVSDATSLLILTRNEATEASLNPTGTPVPGGSICPAGIAAIRNVEIQLNNATLATGLAGQVRQGDHVRAKITLADGCSNVEVTLASYMAAAPFFTWENARSQVLFDDRTVLMATNETILDVDVPLCMYSIDLAIGPLLPTLGPATTNNFYSRQGRLLDSDNGGTTPCA